MMSDGAELGWVRKYYSDEFVTLYHGDCRNVPMWTDADVLVTDPPYGRAWSQGDTGKGRGWASDNHAGILGDDTTEVRDAALRMWGTRPAVVFGDLMLTPPKQTKQVLIYDKGESAGFTGAVGGYRRNVEAVYLIGSGWRSGLGGRSSVLSTKVSAGGNLARTTGHPHTKPLDVMGALIAAAPPGVIADPFAGSGSTLIAARNLGRSVIGVELDEKYCELIVSRLSQQAFNFEELGA
jgi:site-specific DNA-methyltransferase (adenine-specific)